MPASDVIDILLRRGLPRGVSEVVCSTTVHLMESDAALCKRVLAEWSVVPDIEPRYASYQLCWECLESFGARA